MAFFGITVEEIEKIYPHSNADRLSLAQVKGLSFQFVIGKDQFKEGDKVLYFPLDSLLPESLLEKMNLVGKLSGSNRNRVKTIKLRGEVSQGLVFPVDKLLTAAESKLNSEEITNILGIEKYEYPVQELNDVILMGLPAGYSAYDIEGADRYQDIVEIMMDMEVVVMEKMEGMNFSSGKNDEEIFVNQRNNRIKEKSGFTNELWESARNFEIINYLKNSKEENLSFYAEFCGPGIQSNWYKLKKHTLYVFDIKKDFKWVSWAKFKEITKALNIPVAPIIFEGKLRDFLDGKTVQEASDGLSIINPNVLREGIVIKPKVEQRNSKIGRLIIKQRSPKYLAGSDF